MTIIKTNSSPEPLSFASSHTSSRQPSILAVSSACDILTYELRLYAAGEIVGRSFLVSGHRGAGKTTLVYKAIQDLSIEFSEQGLSCYLLLVPLHAPDLLLNHEDSSAKDSQVYPEYTLQSDKKTSATDTPVGTQQALIQITLALYRALANEISRAFRGQIEQNSFPDKAELLELAAQLTRELDAPPNLAALREAWAKAGLLGSGVLFSQRKEDSDQGLRELVALSTAGQAYQRISGTTSSKAVQSSDAENTQELAFSAASAVQTKELLHTLFGVLAGGVVGAGALSGEMNPLFAAVAAVLTAVATTFSLNYSSSRSRTRRLNEETTFIPDNSVATLSRELPTLVVRLREANIAPIFVVDELDKITLPLPEIGRLVGYLKHFVTERSFFCFLTDRNYFEYLSNLSLNSPYPIEHTIFSHRLFVLYRPDDLRLFLRRLLDSSDYMLNQGKCELLFYLLLHRANLHPFDLKQELAKIRDKQGWLVIPEDIDSDPGLRFNIMIQLAIELLLMKKELDNWLKQYPALGQAAYDALYYPTRSWARGDKVLDLSEPAFRKYLAERMGKHHQEVEPGRDEANLAPLNEDNISFLYQQVLELVSLLTEPDTLYKRLDQTRPQDSWSYWNQILSSIPGYDPAKSALQTDLLLLVKKSDYEYQWRYDMSGRLLERPQPPSQFPAALKKDIDFILEFNVFINELSEGKFGLETLSGDISLLATSPNWPSLSLALDRLQQFRQTDKPYEKWDIDQLQVQEYLNMLLPRSPIIGGALALGAAIGAAAGIQSSPERILKGLKSLAAVLNFKAITTDPVNKIENALTTIDHELLAAKANLTLNRDNLSKWKTNVRRLIKEKTKGFSVNGQFKQTWETAWLDRFSDFPDLPQVPFPAIKEDVVCHAREIRPAHLLKLDLNQMTLADWSELLLLALGGKPPDSLDYAPMWMALPALAQLGFKANIPALAQLLYSSDSDFRATYQERTDFDKDVERINSWLSQVKTTQSEPSPQAAGLFVARSEPSLIKSWKPSLRYGGLMVEAARLDDFAATLDKFFQFVFQDGQTWLVFNEVDDQPPNLNEFSARLPSRLQSHLVFNLVSHSARELEPDQHPIRDPQSLDDAMEKALQFQKA
jgi:hypothetical protein